MQLILLGIVGRKRDHGPYLGMILTAFEGGDYAAGCQSSTSLLLTSC